MAERIHQGRHHGERLRTTKLPMLVPRKFMIVQLIPARLGLGQKNTGTRVPHCTLTSRLFCG